MTLTLDITSNTDDDYNVVQNSTIEITWESTTDVDVYAWISFFPAGGASTSYSQFFYLDAQRSGKKTLQIGSFSLGAHELRCFPNGGSYTPVATLSFNLVPIGTALKPRGQKTAVNETTGSIIRLRADGASSGVKVFKLLR
jgi:hypothetical protein